MSVSIPIVLCFAIPGASGNNLPSFTNVLKLPPDLNLSVTIITYNRPKALVYLKNLFDLL